MHQILKSTKFEWMEESNSGLGELGVIFYTISWKYWMLKLWGSRNKLSVWYLVPGSIWCQEWDVWSTAPLQSHCPAGKWIKTDSFHYFRRGNILINNFTKPVRASLGNWIIYQYIGLELHLWQTQYIKTTSYKVLTRLPYSWYGLQGSELFHLKILIKNCVNLHLPQKSPLENAICMKKGRTKSIAFVVREELVQREIRNFYFYWS